MRTPGINNAQMPQQPRMNPQGPAPRQGGMEQGSIFGNLRPQGPQGHQGPQGPAGNRPNIGGGFNPIGGFDSGNQTQGASGLFKGIFGIFKGPQAKTAEGPQKVGDYNPGEKFVEGQPQGDPDTFAQSYADKNGISLEEAKAELKSKYGDPKAQNSDKTEGPKEEGDYNPGEKFVEGQPQGDPDTFAQSYADKKGISLEEAKAELKSKYGDPKAQNSNSKTAEGPQKVGDYNPGEKFVEGQPQGDPDAYAQSYADKKGITLEEAKAELAKLHGTPNKN